MKTMNQPLLDKATAALAVSVFEEVAWLTSIETVSASELVTPSRKKYNYVLTISINLFQKKEFRFYLKQSLWADSKLQFP